MNAHGKVEVYLPSLLSLPLHPIQRSASHPSCFTPT